MQAIRLKGELADLNEAYDELEADVEEAKVASETAERRVEAAQARSACPATLVPQSVIES